MVLADETVLKEGQVKGESVNNIKALATLIEQQVVEYDFQYYQQSYPVSAGVIVISDGRSMFKNTLQVPLPQLGSGKAALPPFDEAKFAQILADQDLLNEFRRYYLLLAAFSEQSLEDYHIPADVSEHAQSIFIEMRKAEHDAKGEVKTTADTFHQWLTLARLVQVSQGSLILTKENFDHARDLERQRLIRVAQAALKPSL